MVASALYALKKAQFIYTFRGGRYKLSGWTGLFTPSGEGDIMVSGWTGFGHKHLVTDSSLGIPWCELNMIIYSDNI